MTCRKGNPLQKKRVEYLKFLRTWLEDKRYRALFGLSDNIELEAEEDLVLQREFRIDFVFRKIEKALLLAGLFSYFRTYNLFEFKSVNDAFDLVQLIKYLGELFWWLYTKDDMEVVLNEVTLTFMTVRKPLNVLKHLEQPHLQIDLINDSPGHYHWMVMGIPVHLLVINELELRPEHYAWLSFAEGKQFETYQEQLSEDVAQDETSQIYIDILRELEKEGKDRMAYEILGRIITEMPPERRGELILNLLRKELLFNLPQKGKDRMAYEILGRIITEMPPERKGELLLNMLVEASAETLLGTVSRLPAEQLQELLAGLPKEQLQKALARTDGGTPSNG